MNVFHLAINLLGVIPMLERFEAEYGTLTSLALFFGGEYLSGFLESEKKSINNNVDTMSSALDNTGSDLRGNREVSVADEYSNHWSQVSQQSFPVMEMHSALTQLCALQYLGLPLAWSRSHPPKQEKPVSGDKWTAHDPDLDGTHCDAAGHLAGDAWYEPSWARLRVACRIYL